MEQTIKLKSYESMNETRGRKIFMGQINKKMKIGEWV